MQKGPSVSTVQYNSFDRASTVYGAQSKCTKYKEININKCLVFGNFDDLCHVRLLEGVHD
jgi:hypothetical protein